LFMTLMPEMLRILLQELAGKGADLAGFLSPLRELIFGALLVGFLNFEPRGLVGLVRRALGQAEVFEATPSQ
jgi:branched-chain amino acid transport system permease protein